MIAVEPYVSRYRHGEWRSKIFADLVLSELATRSADATVLDIGCGKGFDGEPGLQRIIAGMSGTYVGIEPDPDIDAGPHFASVHRSTFENAHIEPATVDVAFAVMVLEHLPEPRRFWDRLHAVLKPGGVFWGFTVDARHWFCAASRLLESTRLKAVYMRVAMGRRGADRYENYPVHYRSNTPRQIRPLTAGFASVDFVNFARVDHGMWSYAPGPLKGACRVLERMWDRFALACGWPGPLLAVRVTR